MIFSLVVLVLVIVGVLISSKDKNPDFADLDSKEHPLKILYPFASRIFGLFVKAGRQELFGANDVLREIYIDEKPEVSLRKQGCKCIASILAVITATAFICFAYAFSKESLIINGNHLKRNPAGGGNRNYNIIMNSEITEKNTMEISVSEQKLQGEEFEKLKTDAAYYLDKKVINLNKSADCVQGKLDLVTEIPGTAITVLWKDENSWFVATDGTLKNEDFMDPVPVTLCAELTYYDENWEYSIDLVIYPQVFTAEELFREKLAEELKSIDIETQTDAMFKLPNNVDDVEIGWYEEKDNTVRNFFLLGLFAAGIMFPAMKRDVKKKQKERNEQMMKDYPDIISKFIMLITAGMTCRGAWDKICRDYIKAKEREGGGAKDKRMRFAYEEMILSNNEMQLGIPEIKVYERFATRCNVTAYNRFGNMLARNIKRGSASIIETLESEAKESFAERRENVRKKGEETGTKLLIPMFGMLMLVIAIIVVPAFSSFSF